MILVAFLLSGLAVGLLWAFGNTLGWFFSFRKDGAPWNWRLLLGHRRYAQWLEEEKILDDLINEIIDWIRKNGKGDNLEDQ